MRWQTKVEPPNREHYLNRCDMLKRSLKHVDIMPPFLVCASCWFVLQKALGNDWLVLRWVVLNMLQHRWSDLTDRMFWTWHTYVRLRTRDEIIELIDQDLKRTTGEDHREWPDVITDEEKVQAD